MVWCGLIECDVFICMSCMVVDMVVREGFDVCDGVCFLKCYFECNVVGLFVEEIVVRLGNDMCVMCFWCD